MQVRFTLSWDMHREVARGAVAQWLQSYACREAASTCISCLLRRTVAKEGVMASLMGLAPVEVATFSWVANRLMATDATSKEHRTAEVVGCLAPLPPSSGVGGLLDAAGGGLF